VTLYDPIGSEGYTQAGRHCSTAPSKDCNIQLKYFYEVICPPSDCNGKTKVRIVGKVVENDTNVASKAKILGTYARFWSTEPIAPLVKPGLNLSMGVVSYLNSDGSVMAFGHNVFGAISNTAGNVFVTPAQEMVDYLGVPIRAKSMGAYGSSHSILARDDGTVWTIGNNAGGDLGRAGVSLNMVGAMGAAVELYGGFTDKGANITGVLTTVTRVPQLRVSPGSIDLWMPVDGPFGNPSLAQVEKVYSATSSFNLVVREDGSAWGLGANSGNRMGFPLKSLAPPPVYVDLNGNTVAHQIFLGASFPSGVTPTPPLSAADYAAIQASSDGFVGHGGNLPAAYGIHPEYNSGPIQAPGLALEFKKSYFLGKDVGLEIKDAAFGPRHGCAINQFDNVVCWGYEGFGVLGRGTLRQDAIDDTLTDSPWSPGSGDPFKKTSKYQNVGRMSSPFYGGTFQSPWVGGAPIPPPAVATPTDFHNVVIDHSGTPLSDVVQIVGAQTHVCARTGSGRVYCWGENNYRQAGVGYPCGYWASSPMQSWAGTPCENSDVATPVVDAAGNPITNAVDIEASMRRTFVVTQDGKLLAAGYDDPPLNYYLGHGSTGYYDRALELDGAGGVSLGHVVDVGTTMNWGYGKSCALNDADEIWCWGSNYRFTPSNASLIQSGSPTYPEPIKISEDLTR